MVGLKVSRIRGRKCRTLNQRHNRMQMAETMHQTIHITNENSSLQGLANVTRIMSV